MQQSARRSISGVAWLVVAVLVWFGPLVITGRTLALRDVLCDFLPWREHAAAALADGHLPLWSHASRLGQPFLAHPQSAVLYPPHLLWNALPSVAALNATLIAHLLLLALGARALARRLGLGEAASVLAAGTLALSTYTVAQMEFLPAFETVCWGPFTAWLAVRVVDAHGPRRRAAWRPLAALALAWGVQALAGHPQALLQNVVIVGVIALARAPWRQMPRALVALVFAGALGAALAAPQILVGWHQLALSTRTGAFDSGMAEASVAPRYFLGLLAPFRAGRPGYGGAWTDDAVYEFWAATCYVGLLPVALVAALAWLRRGPSALRRGCAGMTLLLALGVALAMGRFTPVYPFLARHVPPFDRLRWPGKWLHLVAFSLPFLGAAGLEVALARLRDRGGAWARRAAPLAWAVVAVALLDVGFHSRQVHPSIEADAYHRAPAWAALAPPPGQGRVHTTHSLGQVLLYARGERAWFDWAHDASLGETLLPAGIERTWGFGQLIPLPQWRAWQALQRIDATQAERDRVADLLNVTLIVHGPPLDVRALQNAAPPPIRTLERPGTLQRAFVVGHARTVASETDAWRAALAPSFDPRVEVIVGPGGDDGGLPSARATDPPPGQVIDVVHGANQTFVDVTLERPGMLVLLEPSAPGWVAHLDTGEPLQIRLANGLMQAVALPAGSHRVTFTYREPLLAAGAGIAVIALLFLAVITVAAGSLAPPPESAVPPSS